MFVHNISRIAFEIGPVEVRWYGIMFALGAASYYFLTRWLWIREGRRESGKRDKGGEREWPLADFDSLIVFLFFGLIIGARLGEVFFYNWGYYSSAPGEILKIWEGGLSSHGATIGLFVAYAFFWLWKRFGSRSGKRGKGIAFGKYADILAVCMPLVAGFVRVGNFLNSEIVGRTFDGPWAVVFARNGDWVARHPVQLYEGLWAWIVFGILIWLWIGRDRVGRAGRGFCRGRAGRGFCRGFQGFCRGFCRQRGAFAFLFVGGYFLGRFFIEFFKEYQIGVGSDGLPWGMTMGQGLSVVPVLVAIGWMVWIVVELQRGKN